MAKATKKHKATEYILYRKSDGFVLHKSFYAPSDNKRIARPPDFFLKTIDAKHGAKADCTMSTCDFTIHICLIHCNIILCLCECECELVHIMYMNSDWNSLIVILLMKNTRTHLANTRPRIHTQFDVFSSARLYNSRTHALSIVFDYTIAQSFLRAEWNAAKNKPNMQYDCN